MRDGCCVLDVTDFQSRGGEGAHSRFTARSRPAHPQTAAMAHPAVRTHLDMALDIHRDFFAQVAFDGALFFKNLALAVYLVLRQISDLLVEFNSGPMEQGTRTASADAVNISEPDFRSLLWW